MASFPRPEVYQSSKCFFTHGTMGHLDPKQIPSRAKPWATILSLDFVQRIDVILPQDSYESIRQAFVLDRPPFEFKKVILPLGALVSGAFLRDYIKLGDIMMLSEGRVGIDNVFTLKDGTLTMFVDKETYERAGLVGKPHGAKGKRGLKPRWVIEIDLRSPAMFPSKKGYDRLVQACNKVFDAPVTWLFCNLAAPTPDPDPLEPYFPTPFKSSPGVSDDISVTVPPLKPTVSTAVPSQTDEYENFANETYEWLSLVRLQSPRVESVDVIDPFLSRYRVPAKGNQQQGGNQQGTRLCRLTWEGFFPPTWARGVLADLILSLPSQEWFSLSVSTFPTVLTADASDLTFLRFPSSGGEYAMWEVKGHD